MDYEVIKLNVSNDKIREYKQFEGLKLYSTIIKSQDERTLTNKRIYVTKKNNYVYYERTDTNWNYWSNPKIISLHSYQLKKTTIFSLKSHLT